MRAAAVLPALVGAAIVLAGCGTATLDAKHSVATNKVDLPPSYRFSPDVIRVQPDTTVSWTNHDHFTHSIRFKGGPAAGTHVLKPGRSFRVTFGARGSYTYDCSFHPHDMRGEVIVR